MSKEKPGLPKGTRDFGPEQMILRNHIIGTIRSVFEKYGFLPLETPAMENLSVLTGKYGDEGDQLLYKVLNSGDFLSKASPQHFSDSKSLTSEISEKGLKYDLTVPFARYVVMNQHNITFPFKRYQIQPVWRADRPQKGRYREFYQCDADIVGTKSMICEAEIIGMIEEVFSLLSIENYEIKINNRKVLEGIAEAIGEPERFSEMCVAIDKLDKIGFEKVNEELTNKGFSEKSIEGLELFLNVSGSYREKLDKISSMSSLDLIIDGLGEIKDILSYLGKDHSVHSSINFDVQLARGLSYYTGTIFEVKVKDVSIGSVGGGGRYDDLTGVFGLKDIPGVGFSFGVDRLYDVITELGLFTGNETSLTKVMIVNFDRASEEYGLSILKELRNAGINSEIYPDPVKLKKQMNYADRKKVQFVILAGEEEMNDQKATLKNMSSGEQKRLAVNELVEIIKST